MPMFSTWFHVAGAAAILCLTPVVLWIGGSWLHLAGSSGSVANLASLGSVLATVAVLGSLFPSAYLARLVSRQLMAPVLGAPRINRMLAAAQLIAIAGCFIGIWALWKTARIERGAALRWAISHDHPLPVMRYDRVAARYTSEVPSYSPFSWDAYPPDGLLAAAAFCAAVYLGIFLLRLGFDLVGNRSITMSSDQLETLDLPEGVDESGGPLLAHWSDLHLTADTAVPMLDGKASPNAAFAALVHQYRHRLSETDALLLTGDVTNAGQSGEWKAFFHEMPDELLSRTIVLPGNHDLNLAHPSEVDAMEGSAGVLRKLRLIRLISAIDQIQGDRSWVFPPESAPMLLRAYLEAHAADLAAFAAKPPNRIERERGNAWVDVTPEHVKRVIEAPERVWKQIFPMAVELESSGVVFLIFDSNAPGRNIIDNAFGRVSRDSLVRHGDALKWVAGRKVIYLLHHHVALPPATRAHIRNDPRSNMLYLFMVLENAAEFLITVRRAPTVIFHGHRHTEFLGQLKSAQVISAPSTTLGDELPGNPHPEPGFYLFRADASGEGVCVTRKEWFPLQHG